MKSEKQLYQWDVNQYLTELQPTAQFVDYPMGNEVIRIETDGKRCRIPDEFLKTAGFKTCYEHYSDGTYKAYSFNVQSSPKPPDYVYTAEERTTFDALVAKADAAIAEIKRRADSGEFTPKKGVDYFTDAEKTELMEGVSSGAVGEFRKVVDTATAEYNANAAEKLTTYDTNDEQRTSDYNRNAEVKLEAYNQNHTAKVAEYNQNAENKTAEFDANAAALQTEVDRLRGECDTLAAENRKQENRISALMKLNKGQTYDILPEEGESASRTAPSGAKYVSVDNVGGKSLVWNQLVDGSNLPTTKTINGITFTNNGDGSITVDGTATANADLNLQRVDNTTIIGHKYLMLGGAAGGSIQTYFYRYDSNGGTQAYDYGNGAIFTKTAEATTNITIRVISGVTVSGLTFKPQLVDLTSMFGAGNEPSTVEEFEAMFHADYYPYSKPTIISSQTDRVDARGKNLFDKASMIDGYYDSSTGKFFANSSVKATPKFKLNPSTNYVLSVNEKGIYGYLYEWSGDDYIGRRLIPSTGVFTTSADITLIAIALYDASASSIPVGELIQLEEGSVVTEYSPYRLQQVTTGFPVLNSAGSVYDYIDLNEGKLHQRVGVVDLGTLNWKYSEPDGWHQVLFKNRGRNNLLCDRYKTDKYELLNDKTIGCNSAYLVVVDTSYTDGNALKQALQGVMLYYELAEEVITDITIPTELTDWLEVEAGGSVTFHDADESKQLPVPNAVSWVRKLNEVE